MLVLSDREVIRHITRNIGSAWRDRQPHFVCYFGAGGSLEAEVPAAIHICRMLRKDLRKEKDQPEHANEWDSDQWDIDNLDWGKSTCYTTCMKEAFRDIYDRVDFFRQLLKGKTPSFAHHALALLMRNRYLKQTCLTTNFDKLIETAFSQQDAAECQPIRNDQETGYWTYDENRHFVLKLHGDYDTDNIRNTAVETKALSEALKSTVAKVLDGAGLVVVGTAGSESSVREMLNKLVEQRQTSHILRRGLFWGVYAGPTKPDDLKDPDLEYLVKNAIKQGAVSTEMDTIIRGQNDQGYPFHYFPVWGAGGFFYDLVNATGNPDIIDAAALYLDHNMRLRHTFSIADLSSSVINKHIKRLEARQDALDRATAIDAKPEDAFIAKNDITQCQVRIIYGDITSRWLLSEGRAPDTRVAVVSPEDTCISAGGGVAYLLLKKAGKQFILNELTKLGTIEQGQVVVTSGGKLGAEYIFHAAATKISEDGDEVNYDVTKDSVRQSVKSVLEKAAALEVDTVYIPLLGAGVPGLAAQESIEGILEAVADWDASAALKLTAAIVVFRCRELEPSVVGDCLSRILEPPFVVKKVS